MHWLHAHAQWPIMTDLSIRTIHYNPSQVTSQKIRTVGIYLYLLPGRMNDMGNIGCDSSRQARATRWYRIWGLERWDQCRMWLPRQQKIWPLWLSAPAYRHHIKHNTKGQHHFIDKTTSHTNHNRTWWTVKARSNEKHKTEPHTVQQCK